MLSSFTTFIAVLLAANLSPATAFTFSEYRVVIERVNPIETDCTTAVNAEINEVIRLCVLDGTGVNKLPHQNVVRRRAEVAIDDTPRDESRHRQLDEPECFPPPTCSLAEQMLNEWCCYTCEGCQECSRRRVEERPGFLRGGDGERELTPADDVSIYGKCFPALKAYAKVKKDTNENKCLGDDNHLDIVVTSSA